MFGPLYEYGNKGRFSIYGVFPKCQMPCYLRTPHLETPRLKVIRPFYIFLEIRTLFCPEKKAFRPKLGQKNNFFVKIEKCQGCFVNPALPVSKTDSESFRVKTCTVVIIA